MKICPQCRHENDDGVENCHECGAELGIWESSNTTTSAEQYVEPLISPWVKWGLYFAAWGAVVLATICTKPADLLFGTRISDWFFGCNASRDSNHGGNAIGVGGKKSMPSRASGEATAVARTTVSPVLTSAAPEAAGHAPRFKNQPLATGKLDGYFVLRHTTSPRFIVCSLENLVLGRRRRVNSRRANSGTRSAHSCAPSLAAGRVRQVHHGPTSCS